MSAPDPRPVKRHKAEVDEWKILRKLKLGPCRVCGSSVYGWDWPIELHHLVGRDLGGDDLPANLVPLCRGCHCLVEERSKVECQLLRASLTLKEYAYVLDTKGTRFLDRYYPRPEVAA